MSEYVLQIPNEEAPEVQALLRYLGDLGFVRLVRQTPQNEPAFERPAESQRQQAVGDMVNFLASRPSVNYSPDDVAEAIRERRQQTGIHE